MILKDEHDMSSLENIFVGLVDENVPFHRGLSFKELMTYTIDIKNKDIHYNLRDDLIEYLWIVKDTNLYALILLSIRMSIWA